MTVVLKGDKRRPSGQGPGARVFYGLSSHELSGITGSPRPCSQPGPPREAGSALPAGDRHPGGGLRPPAPAKPGRNPAGPHPGAGRATERQRPAPGSSPQPRAKFSGPRDRPRRAGFSQRLSADHLVLELHEDEDGFGDVADRGRADADVLDGAPALSCRALATPTSDASAPLPPVATTPTRPVSGGTAPRNGPNTGPGAGWRSNGSGRSPRRTVPRNAPSLRMAVTTSRARTTTLTLSFHWGLGAVGRA